MMEWIMARMVLHPDIQAKAQAELDAVVGRGRGVTDADVANLPYIQCVVKETLRMHRYYRTGLCYRPFVPAAFGPGTIGGFCPESNG